MACVVGYLWYGEVFQKWKKNISSSLQRDLASTSLRLIPPAFRPRWKWRIYEFSNHHKFCAMSTLSRCRTLSYNLSPQRTPPLSLSYKLVLSRLTNRARAQAVPECRVHDDLNCSISRIFLAIELAHYRRRFCLFHLALLTSIFDYENVRAHFARERDSFAHQHTTQQQGETTPNSISPNNPIALFSIIVESILFTSSKLIRILTLSHTLNLALSLSLIFHLVDEKLLLMLEIWSATAHSEYRK